MARLLRRAVSRLIPTGLPLPILRGPLRRHWWISGAGAGAGKGLSTLVNGSETSQLAFAASVAPAGGVAFDVGANVGLYTLLFSARCRRVVSFEPSPRNVSYLHRLARLNHLENVTVVPWAVSDRTGLAAFELGGNPSLGHLAEAGGQPVATVSLDAFIERYGVTPDILKIDVEGAEAEVLRGADRLLRATHPILLLSTHGPDRKAACLALLEAAGYRTLRPLDGPTVEACHDLAVLP